MVALQFGLMQVAEPQLKESQIWSKVLPGVLPANEPMNLLLQFHCCALLLGCLRNIGLNRLGIVASARMLGQVAEAEHAHACC